MVSSFPALRLGIAGARGRTTWKGALARHNRTIRPGRDREQGCTSRNSCGDSAGGELDAPNNLPARTRDPNRLGRGRNRVTRSGWGWWAAAMALSSAVYRIAARMDGQFEWAAGELSSDPERGRASALEAGAPRQRAPTALWRSRRRRRGTRASAGWGSRRSRIVTPDHLHFAAAKAGLEAGFHVICDKPMTSTVHKDAETLSRIVESSGKLFISHPTTRATRWCGRLAPWWRRRGTGTSALCMPNMPSHPGHRASRKHKVEGAEWRTDPQAVRCGLGQSAI